MEQRSKNTSELIFNSVLLIVGGIIIGMSIKLGFGTLRKPGTGLVPLWTGLIILISATVLIIPRGRPKASGTFFSKQEIYHLFAHDPCLRRLDRDHALPGLHSWNVSVHVLFFEDHETAGVVETILLVVRDHSFLLPSLRRLVVHGFTPRDPGLSKKGLFTWSRC